MSEVPRIGRNPVYIGTLIVFVALQVPTALAVDQHLGMLLAFRFLTGFFFRFTCIGNGGFGILLQSLQLTVLIATGRCDNRGYV